MNKKEIAQAQELIDSVRRGDPPRMVEAVFPEGDQMSSETTCGQSGRDAELLRMLESGIIYYGPHRCDCGAMICRVSLEQGGMKFNYPEGIIYPNTNWVQHVCAGEPVRPATAPHKHTSTCFDDRGNCCAESAPAVPDAAARLAEKIVGFLRTIDWSASSESWKYERIAALIREAGEMRPAPEPRCGNCDHHAELHSDEGCTVQIQPVTGNKNTNCPCEWNRSQAT